MEQAADVCSKEFYPLQRLTNEEESDGGYYKRYEDK